MTNCELCHLDPKSIIWKNDQISVIAVHDCRYPGYVRAIWNDHKAEMTDLSMEEQSIVWKVLMVIERTMRDHMTPHKVNWAQFGNMVPHLHWHAIPRYCDDDHFPQPTWGVKQRDCDKDVIELRLQKEAVFLKALALNLADQIH